LESNVAKLRNERTVNPAVLDLGPSELTRSSDGTLHGQLYRTLVNLISRSDVKPGQKMPTEAELMTSYSVSRSTARRALDELRRENLVERIQGKGTFVAEPRLGATIPHLHSVTEEIEQLGYRAGSRILSLRKGQADAASAEQLNLGIGSDVLFLERLRTADERQFYFSRSVLNATAFPGLLDADYTSPSLSLYKLFEQITGRRVRRVTQWLSAVGAAKDVARHLGLRTGAPVLQLDRVLFIGDQVPIEAVRAWFLGESYKFYSELVAPGG
jgi:GntR family transcriptional regulator